MNRTSERILRLKRLLAADVLAGPHASEAEIDAAVCATFVKTILRSEA